MIFLDLTANSFLNCFCHTRSIELELNDVISCEISLTNFILPEFDLTLGTIGVFILLGFNSLSEINKLNCFHS